MDSPLLTTKIFASMAYTLVFCSALSWAAPTKRQTWEYATVDFSANRKEGNSYRYGAELILPGKKAIFLETKDATKPNYKNYLLNRLGAQGWELAFIPGYRANDGLYVFKRQK